MISGDWSSDVCSSDLLRHWVARIHSTAENFLGNIVDFHYLFSVKFLFIVLFYRQFRICITNALGRAHTPKDARACSKAPSGRELPTKSGEGECVTIKLAQAPSHAGSFRHASRATFLPEEGYVTARQYTQKNGRIISSPTLYKLNIVVGEAISLPLYF